MIALDDDTFQRHPYDLPRNDKDALLRQGLRRLTQHHAARCEGYGRIVALLGFDATLAHEVHDYPLLPARLFKTHDLKSIGQDEVKVLLTSSGTSGQSPSRIALDASAATLQSRALSRIVCDFIGRERLPMLIVDAPGTVGRTRQFSARAAGILGFSMFGREKVYALKDDMSLDVEALESFAARHRGRQVLVFGFTFMIYQHLICSLEAMGRTCDLGGGVLIHGGGWKKLGDRAVSSAAFKARLRAVTDIHRVNNYYGVVEQTGSIFMECEAGHLHCSNFSDLLIRDSQFRPLPQGQRGLVQLISLLAQTYPGHSLLTEDEGTVLGEDDCACGRKGKYFAIHGRVANAEIRGCSDTYAT